MLADVDYTAEEKELIAGGIIVDFITENDEDESQEPPSIARVRVTGASENGIDIQIDYINPAAVSKDPVSPD